MYSSKIIEQQRSINYQPHSYFQAWLNLIRLSCFVYPYLYKSSRAFFVKIVIGLYANDQFDANMQPQIDFGKYGETQCYSKGKKVRVKLEWYVFLGA